MIRRLVGFDGAGAAACVIETGFPAIVTTAVRAVEAAFWAAVYVIAPGPVPDAGTVSHWAELDAVHAQPLPMETVSVPVPAAAPIDALEGETVAVQLTPD
jgi:hypothetical protein